uniref:Major facilitator superfamily (MFS) profile domain-containing protein n=1 Tax=Plectus sambesii TaxID=2011161 RepID=A0A914X3P0_9BILA
MASRYGSMSDSGRKQRQYNRSGRHAIKHNEKSPLLFNHAKTDVEDLPGSSHGSMEVLMPQGRFSSYRQLSNDLRRLRSNNNNRPKSTQTLTIITHFNDDDDEDDDYAKYSTDSHGILNRSGGGGVGDGASGNVKLAPFTKRQLLTVIMLSFANFCSTVVFSCIAPFFPDEARSKGLNPTQIGIIFGILELVMFISAPILGKYLHIIGSKFMFTTGLFATGITSILFGLLNLTDSGPMFFWLSFIVRCFEAVADAAFLTASFAICARTFPGRIATVVGILETFTGLGFTVGPAIGGLLYELGGYQVPFSVLGSLLLIAALLSYFLLDPSIEDDNMDDSKGVLALLKIPMIVLMMAAVMTCAMTLTFVDPTLAAHLNSFNLSTVVVGLMFLWGAGVYTITAPFWGYFIDRFKHTPLFLMLIGALLSFVAMIFIGPTPIFGFN